MELAALQSRAASPAPSLDRLAGNAHLSEQEKIAEAGRQFEAILVRQILSEATKPVFKSAFTPNSAQAGIYQDMVVNQLADNVTRSGGLGLAHSLDRELSRQLRTAPTASTPAAHD